MIGRFDFYKKQEDLCVSVFQWHFISKVFLSLFKIGVGFCDHFGKGLSIELLAFSCL